MTPKNDKYAIGKNLLIAVMTAVGLFSAIIFLSNSWIKIVTISLIAIMIIGWLVSHGLLRQTLKYTLLAVTIFSLSFATFEGYARGHIEYPPTFGTSQPGVTISYPHILDVSLIEAVQSVKNTLAFKLLMLEHPGETIIGIIALVTIDYQGGRIEFILSQQASNSFFNAMGRNPISFSAQNGEAYKIYDVPTVSLTDNALTASQIPPQQQTSNKSLQQIDDLGLQWYYNCAIEAYQNKTGIIPEITGLRISFCNYGSFQSGDMTYEGPSLEILGSDDYNNSPFGRSVFLANFQPNGTLNLINILK
ncbi:MAG: hypothetical protein LBH79_02785 [Nitrososphaerota archaeon]|jgi:hypothetical protein|nr:hypothetical protein [Nitrososphaerota archaeon]